MLLSILEEYSRIVNIFIDLFWQNDFKFNDLVKEIYSIPDTWLSAAIRQDAAREALSMCKTANQFRKKSQIELEVEELLKDTTVFNERVKPAHKANRMILSSKIVSIQKGRNSFDFWVVLTSIGNKIKISIPIKKHRHFNKFFENGWKLANSIIIKRDCIQFSFEKETGPKKIEGKCIGVDVGINHLLATSEGELYGSETKILLNKIKQKKQGSRAQKRAKQTLSNHLHRVVKNCLDWRNLRLVVVEKLKGLKLGKRNRTKEFRKLLSHWNYGELLNVIQLRCEENRVSFRTVSPYKTSQRCPMCNHTEKKNRNKEEFKCLKCGYSNQADLVGSLNILQRFLTGSCSAGFQI